MAAGTGTGPLLLVLRPAGLPSVEERGEPPALVAEVGPLTGTAGLDGEPWPRLGWLEVCPTGDAELGAVPEAGEAGLLAPPDVPEGAGEEVGLVPPPIGLFGAAVGLEVTGREVEGLEA